MHVYLPNLFLAPSVLHRSAFIIDSSATKNNIAKIFSTYIVCRSLEKNIKINIKNVWSSVKHFRLYILYRPAEWNKTRRLIGQIFDFHFQFRVMTYFVFP